MRIATHISCLLLALLLPAGLLVSGGKARAAASRSRLECVAAPVPASGEHANGDAHGAPQELHTQGLNTYAWGSLPGSGSMGSGAHAFFILPGAFPMLPGCSKSVLRLRLRSMLGHFTYQQRLALYPKHSFW